MKTKILLFALISTLAPINTPTTTQAHLEICPEICLTTHVRYFLCACPSLQGLRASATSLSTSRSRTSSSWLPTMCAASKWMLQKPPSSTRGRLECSRSSPVCSRWGGLACCEGSRVFRDKRVAVYCCTGEWSEGWLLVGSGAVEAFKKERLVSREHICN